MADDAASEHVEKQSFFDTPWVIPTGLVVLVMTLGSVALLPAWQSFVGLGAIAVGGWWLLSLRVQYRITSVSLEIHDGKAVAHVPLSEITRVMETQLGPTLPFKFQGKAAVKAWNSGLNGQVVGLAGKTLRIDVGHRHFFLRTDSEATRGRLKRGASPPPSPG